MQTSVNAARVPLDSRDSNVVTWSRIGDPPSSTLRPWTSPEASEALSDDVEELELDALGPWS